MKESRGRKERKNLEEEKGGGRQKIRKAENGKKRGVKREEYRHRSNK